MKLIAYKSTRLCLEEKAKEFKKVAEYSHQHQEKYFNSAISRYYYSMYIRIMQMCRTFDNRKNNGNANNANVNNFMTHQLTVRKFHQEITGYITFNKSLNLDDKLSIFKLLGQLESCCILRNTADYKEDTIRPKDVKLLKETLDLFDSVYPVLLKIAEIEKYERNDVDGKSNNKPVSK